MPLDGLPDNLQPPARPNSSDPGNTAGQDGSGQTQQVDAQQNILDPGRTYQDFSGLGLGNQLNHTFGYRLERLIKDGEAKFGIRIGVTSAFRTYDEQSALFEDYDNGLGDGNLAAPPGTSNHEFGFAVDLTMAGVSTEIKEWFHDQAPAYGLAFPVGGEDWHIEPADISELRAGGEGKYSGTPGTYGGEGTGSTPRSEADFGIENFGYLSAFLDLPIVGDLLRRAANEEWTMLKLEHELAQTEWWRTTSATQRTFDSEGASDPATQQAAIEQRSGELTDQAALLGFELAEEKATEIARMSLRNGWNTDQIAGVLVAESKFDPDKPLGELNTSQDQILAAAKNYMVTMTSKEATALALEIVNGTASMSSIKGNLASRAESKFGGNEQLGTYIRNGGSPSQFFADHRTTISEMIGVEADSIDLTSDPRYSQVLSHVGEDGKERPMTVHETKKLARGDGRYQTSETGRNEAAQMAAQFAQSMGLAKF
tara:strand:+ start:8038 stop:9489 length:1452 start_codon:yes stop_codon:yes gene_type:complete